MEPCPVGRGGPSRCHCTAGMSMTTRLGLLRVKVLIFSGSEISTTNRVLSVWSPIRALITTGNWVDGFAFGAMVDAALPCRVGLSRKTFAIMSSTDDGGEDGGSCAKTDPAHASAAEKTT